MLGQDRIVSNGIGFDGDVKGRLAQSRGEVCRGFKTLGV